MAADPIAKRMPVRYPSRNKVERQENDLLAPTRFVPQVGIIRLVQIGRVNVICDDFRVDGMQSCDGPLNARRNRQQD